MRLTIIALVLCACVYFSLGDSAHLKYAKVKLIGRLAKGKHHKRGVLSAVPPYKLGYDIPVVTHSVVKPVVVSYPPAAAVTNVKVPLAHPLTPVYPAPVGHKVPGPHPHYGFRYPHHTKAVLWKKPDQYFEHHHHHVAPKSVIPEVTLPPVTPVIPIEPTATVAHPVPAPSPPVHLQHAPVPVPAPIFSAAALAHTHLFPQKNTYLNPVDQYSTAAYSPAPPSILQYGKQFQYVLSPGNAVQASFFANYPRYPLLNYQTQGIPLAQAPPPFSQVLYERPQAPFLHLTSQAGQEGVVYEQPSSHIGPTFVHAQHPVHLHTQQSPPLQSVQPDIEISTNVHQHPSQQEVHLHPSQPEVHLQSVQPEFHLQPVQPAYNLQPGQQDVHLQQGQQDVHIHPGQPEVYHHQGQPEVHYHQNQPEVHLHGGQPGVLQTTQPALDQDGWHPVQTQPHNQGAVQPGGQFGQDGQFAQGFHFGIDDQFGQDDHRHQITQEQGTQVYEQHTGDQQYNPDFQTQNQLQHHIQQQIEKEHYAIHVNNQQQHHGQDGYFYKGGQDLSKNEHNFSQQSLVFSGQGSDFGPDFSQDGPNFGLDLSQQQPAGEYGIPQGAEGRSSAEVEEEPRYHNHIPLMLLPPLERPLGHFH